VSAEGAADGWSRWAPLYRLQLPLERFPLRALAELLEVRESESLLDLGTGTAALLRELARSPHPPRSAVGVDRARGMLERAPRLPPGWRLVEADVRALPFDDGSFGLVTASYLLHLLDERARAQTLAEARRVLAPGGRLGVVSVAPPVGRPASIASSPVRALAARSGPLAGLRPLDPRPDLLAAGFRPTRARRVSMGYPSLCVVAER
jgi:ubiquinone/menaquinone biosynthesis C-methylase UbiE